jgi:hypothetical protein
MGRIERAENRCAALQWKGCGIFGRDAGVPADTFQIQLNSAQIRGFLWRFPQRRCARA